MYTPVRYKDEVWTGIEYQVAGHMVWEGMVEEGLSICRAVHDRYHPAKRNPYNEVECSDHYARALASWGVYTALAGFEYDGPRGRLSFSPRITPERFRAAFTAAEGWGTFSQTIDGAVRESRIDLRWGTLRLAELGLDLGPEVDLASVELRFGGEDLDGTVTSEGGRLRISFPEPIVLTAGRALVVRIAR